MNIYLIGFMGTGKSTVGKALAKHLDFPFLDLDVHIEKQEGRMIPTLFSENGEAYFRRVETSLLREVSLGQTQVVSTGGGAVINPENREIMRSTGFIISLYADKETIKDRVSRQENRPLLTGEDFDMSFDRLMQQRKEFYEQADLLIDTSHQEVEQIVDTILNNPLFPAR